MQATEGVPVLDVDPFDEAVLADPVALHSQIRETAPAVWIPKYSAWFVGRDAEVRQVLTDWARFSSASGVGLTNIKRDGGWQKPSAILEVDPPDHAVTRRVLNQILSPKAMRGMRADFERFAVELVDELLERRTFDLIDDLAFRFPFTVLPDAVGLPAIGREHLTLYSTMYFNSRIPANRLADTSAAAAERQAASTGSRRRAAARTSHPVASVTRSTAPPTAARSTTRPPGSWCARSSVAASTRPCSASAACSTTSPTTRPSGICCVTNPT